MLSQVRRFVLLFSWTSFVLLLLTACSTPHATRDVESGKAPDLGQNRVSLWKIEHDSSIVYLLGSVHALTPEEYPLPASMERAFMESDQTVFEVDLTITSDTDIAALLRQLAFYVPPRSLQTELSDDTLVLLKRYLSSHAMDFDAVKMMKPWFLSLTLALDELESLSYDADLGIDQYFQRKAQRFQKPIYQLESISEQFELLASDLPDVQELTLKANLEESDQVERQINELIDAWRIGDADEMWRVAVNENKYPALDGQMEKLIDNRNIQMTNKIRQYLQSKRTTLVVVGALHIGGPKGILSLLSPIFEIEQMRAE